MCLCQIVVYKWLNEDLIYLNYAITEKILLRQI